MPDERPNVVLLTSHDTGRHVSPYGFDTVDTPNFERLAAESVQFNNAYCTAPLCSPSRAAIATGRHPHANGVMGLVHGNFGWDLHNDEKCIAQLMRAAGYETWLMAGQHECTDSARLGFEVIDDNHPLFKLPEHMKPRLDQRDPGRPLFCQIGGFETHRGWEVFDTPPDDSKGVHVPPYLNDGPETRAELAQFQGAVKLFDRGVGQLLDMLEEAGMVENTILIVTTDHGIAMPRAKSTLYDPGIETLLFIRYPDGGWGAGRTEDGLVSNVDLLPTLLEACGIDAPPNLHGVSFKGLLDGQTAPRDAIFAEKNFHEFYDPMRCVRTDRYKYVCNFHRGPSLPLASDFAGRGAHLELGDRYGGARPDEELYDLEQDPDEMTNLAGRKELADVLKDMRRRLGQWMLETDDPLRHGPIESPTHRRSVERLFAGG